MKAPLLIASFLLLIAVLPMPYGYYLFMRIAITIVAGIMAYNLFKTTKKLLCSIFVVVAILYNPIIVIHFEKAIWSPINIFTALFFVVFAFVNTNTITLR